MLEREDKMDDGLEISEKEFCKMKQSDQNLILYKNVQEIKKMVAGYKLYYKITAAIGAILTTGMGYLFMIHLK